MDVAAATAGATGITAKSAAKPAGSGLIDNDFQTFLVMLTAQMQNQDPMNPIDSTDYAVQLATFSGVEQQVRTNQLLESLSGQMGGGIAQFAGWVGMEARSTAPARFDGAPITLNTEPRAGADRMVLVAVNESGREISRHQLSALSGQIDWTGRDQVGAVVPPGTYSFKLESYGGDALLGTDPVESYARIAEVQSGRQGPVLVLDSGAQIAPASVTALRAGG